MLSPFDLVGGNSTLFSVVNKVFYLSVLIKPHLSKGLSDLKQNGTQEKKLFSGTVSHCLSCGVVLFVLTVSFWSQQIEASHWLKEEF